MNAIVNQFLAVTLLVSFFIGFTWAVTGCYHCNPDETGCSDPIKHQISTYDACADLRPNDILPHDRVLLEQRTRAGSENIIYTCAVIQVRSTFPNRTGIYRTCLVKNPSNDGCDVLSTEFKEQGYGDTIGCVTCDDDYCNHITEDTIQNSGKMTFSSVLLYTLFSVLFVTYVF